MWNETMRHKTSTFNLLCFQFNWCLLLDLLYMLIEDDMSVLFLCCLLCCCVVCWWVIRWGHKQRLPSVWRKLFVCCENRRGSELLTEVTVTLTGREEQGGGGVALHRFHQYTHQYTPLPVSSSQCTVCSHALTSRNGLTSVSVYGKV